jgi:hypothetical protein
MRVRDFARKSLNHQLWRSFHTKPPRSFLEIPLSEPLPGYPKASGVFRHSPLTQIVTLGKEKEEEKKKKMHYLVGASAFSLQLSHL